MPERIKMIVRESSAHPGVLTIQDAMQQVLDFFGMIEPMPGVEWALINASTNSPLFIEAEARSFEASVDVSVVARAQKNSVARNLKEITAGRPPVDEDFRVSKAKTFLARNMNGVGATEIDLETEVIKISPALAKVGLQALGKIKDPLYQLPSARDEMGSLEGTLHDLGTHYNHPAVRILESRRKVFVWCRLSPDLQEELQDRTRYKDFWLHRRVVLRGRIWYGGDGDVDYMYTDDITRIPDKAVSLEQIRDPDFTGGLSVAEYLDRFREGTLG